MQRQILILMAAIWLLGIGQAGQSRAAELVYDNSQNPMGRYWGTDKEFGDEITLVGEAEEHVITRFRFEAFTQDVSSDATGVLRFYKNNGRFDGLDQKPGDLLFESVRFPLNEGVEGLTLEQVSIEVPRNFTWTIEFSGVESGKSGLTLYDPVAKGESQNFFWINDPENGWQLTRFAGGGIPMNFGAQIHAESTLPEEDALSLELTVRGSVITLKGEPFQPYRIQRSKDLVNWETITTEVSRTGTITVRDTRSGEDSRCFYRAIRP